MGKGSIFVFENFPSREKIEEVGGGNYEKKWKKEKKVHFLGSVKNYNLYIFFFLIKWFGKIVEKYMYISDSLVRERIRKSGGGTREKSGKREKSTLFLKESVKNYNLIYFSYKVIIGEK